MDPLPESGRSPGEENGYPPQYSCLENSMGRGAWWVAVHGITESLTQLSEYNESVQLYCFDSAGMICRAQELHKGPQIVRDMGEEMP